MTIEPRSISHFDLDTFFVSASRLQHPELIGRPVMVGGFSERAVVSSCSREARRVGVHAGMPMKLARRLCPEGVVIRGDFDFYQRKSAEVTELIGQTVPCVEKASIDEHYLDLTGMDRFFGIQKLVHELRQRIEHETGLPISYGLSINKTVAKIATGEAKHGSGELYVPQTQVQRFLWPLSIEKMPGIGDKTAELLHRMGVHSLGALAALPREAAHALLGKNGNHLWERANGIDPSPVEAYSERKSISTEHTFDTDTTDKVFLRHLLVEMTDKLCYQLRSQQRLVSVVSVKIRYANFDTHTRQHRVAHTALDHQIAQLALQLFEQLYNRRLRVRLLGLKLDGLVHGFQQLDLFDPCPRLPKLYTALDHIRQRFGVDAIGRASSLQLSPKPDAPDNAPDNPSVADGLIRQIEKRNEYRH